MRDSKGLYQRVACACSEYSKKTSFPGKVYDLHNSCSDQKPSCMLCRHFKDEHCVLDLYDKIVERIGK